MKRAKEVFKLEKFPDFRAAAAVRPVQYFTKEYLEQCRTMKPEQIVRFLEDFRILHRSALKARTAVKARSSRARKG
jgi:hypothetical protein